MKWVTKKKNEDMYGNILIIHACMKVINGIKIYERLIYLRRLELLNIPVHKQVSSGHYMLYIILLCRIYCDLKFTRDEMSLFQSCV